MNFRRAPRRLLHAVSESKFMCVRYDVCGGGGVNRPRTGIQMFFDITLFPEAVEGARQDWFPHTSSNFLQCAIFLTLNVIVI